MTISEGRKAYQLRMKLLECKLVTQSLRALSKLEKRRVSSSIYYGVFSESWASEC